MYWCFTGRGPVDWERSPFLFNEIETVPVPVLWILFAEGVGGLIISKHFWFGGRKMGSRAR